MATTTGQGTTTTPVRAAAGADDSSGPGSGGSDDSSGTGSGGSDDSSGPGSGDDGPDDD